MLNRDALGPLPNYFRKSCVFFHFGGIVPRLVWALGGTTLLNAIPWAVVQVWENPRSSSACRPLWPPRVVQGRLSARNPARVGCSHRLPLCPLLYEHYSFAVGADSEELLLPPHCIVFTTDEGSKLSLIASHRIRRGGGLPRRIKLQRVLGRVLAVSAMVTGVRHLSFHFLQVFHLHAR